MVQAVRDVCHDLDGWKDCTSLRLFLNRAAEIGNGAAKADQQRRRTKLRLDADGAIWAAVPLTEDVAAITSLDSFLRAVAEHEAGLWFLRKDTGSVQTWQPGDRRGMIDVRKLVGPVEIQQKERQ
ncbi:hypothetical protein D2T31_09355 [Sinirhodobacter populi]|uniref:Uncharacterized protein n=1 Tax=Paenirhodobacter populi TaxID=2306993 RepID=A0A443KA61_9RHOB|nr:hypothetical protein [Sinirhodobacter populi]RWR29640.1 hypothetical protein D2T31_09355 [Sinirhodobacter populi]